MEHNSSINIQEAIKAGRIVEARTLLTIHKGTLSEQERNAFDQEIARLYGEAEALITKAEAMETAGSIEEAKALYASVLLFAVDFPGIQSHIKRMEESLFLTKAVKRRSRRIREAIPIGQRVPQKKKSTPLLGTTLAVGALTVVLVLFLRTPPPETAPRKVDPNKTLHIASTQPISAPEKAPSPEPTTTKVEQPVVAEPVSLPETKEAPAVAVMPVQPPVTLTQAAEPVIEKKNQTKDEQYTVRPGDSLSLIAERQFCYRDAWKEIYQLNREQVTDPDRLHPGMLLQVKGIKNRCHSAP